jgi:hypothetical protein
VVTMDELWKDNINGVQHIHIQDFLTNKNYWNHFKAVSYKQ